MFHLWLWAKHPFPGKLPRKLLVRDACILTAGSILRNGGEICGYVCLCNFVVVNWFTSVLLSGLYPVGVKL